MRRFFFLRCPTCRKVDDGKKIVTRSNLDDREDTARMIGEEEFFTNEEYSGYWDIAPPDEFAWIFFVFMEIYRTCDERMSFSDIEAWQNVRATRLSQYEVGLLLDMAGWAADEVSELRKMEE
ncbi:MAG: hypothetical protein IKP60_07205 [Treponema sp.]|nr:hypothetical protein [Treponema sp.]